MIFEKAGVESKRHAMIGTVCMGVIKLAFETYALLNVDRIGRRLLLLVGSAGLTATLVVLGTALRAKVASGVLGVTPATYAIFGSIGLYSALHAISFGPITWLVLAEIFPAAVKGKAMGIATTVNRLTSFVAALTFLTMCDRLQWGGTFYVYAALSAFALLFFALLVPETTGLPLEEISPLFDAPREPRRNLAALGVRAAAAKHLFFSYCVMMPRSSSAAGPGCRSTLVERLVPRVERARLERAVALAADGEHLRPAVLEPLVERAHLLAVLEHVTGTGPASVLWQSRKRVSTGCPCTRSSPTMSGGKICVMLLRTSPKPAASALSARGSVYAGLIGCRCAPWSSSAGGRRAAAASSPTASSTR